MTRHPIWSLLLSAVVALTMQTVYAQTSPTTAPALRFNHMPPELAVTTLEAKSLTLADLPGQPVVLQFGSITDPAFRQRQPAAEKLAAAYAAKAKFYIIYQKEAYPADGPNSLEANAIDGYALAAPTSQKERLALAKQAATRLKLTAQTILVDEWNNTTSRRYGGPPNMTFLLDAKGNLAAAYRAMDTDKLQGALDDVLAGKPVAAAHQGPTRSTRPDPRAPEEPGQAFGAVTVLLDGMNLSEAKKNAILPPLTQYLADLRAIREHLVTDSADKSAAATQAAVSTQAALTRKAKASAATLQAALHDNLAKDEYDKVLEAIKHGPGRAFFED